MDVFGPIADNANGIGEMGYDKDEMEKEEPGSYKRARQMLADLDAVVFAFSLLQALDGHPWLVDALADAGVEELDYVPWAHQGSLDQVVEDWSPVDGVGQHITMGYRGLCIAATDEFTDRLVQDLGQLVSSTPTLMKEARYFSSWKPGSIITSRAGNGSDLVCCSRPSSG